MYALVYQPSFPHWVFVIVDQQAVATHHQKVGEHVVIYEKETIIGINVWVEPSLRKTIEPGIQRHPSKQLLDYLETSFKSIALPFPFIPFSSGFLKARIIEKEVHPDADHLYVCKVDLGKEVKQIVTNSSTVQVGDGVVVAIAGSLLLDGTMMKVTSMLKQTTEGMFCSQKTLGIQPVTHVGVITFAFKDEELGKDYFSHA